MTGPLALADPGWVSDSEPSRIERAQRARLEAADFGIDIGLLEANLALSPAERLRANEASLRIAARARSQTLGVQQRERLARSQILEEIRAYGFDEVIARYDALKAREP